MPTASTSQILGNNECFEAFTSNIYLRRVLSGEFVIVNRFLIEDLVELDVWSDDMKNAIIANDGSIQSIVGLPDQVKELYKTVWEIPQTVIVKMAADRAPFIDQSQSMNLHIAAPDYQTLTNLHIMGWKMVSMCLFVVYAAKWTLYSQDDQQEIDFFRRNVFRFADLSLSNKHWFTKQIIMKAVKYDRKISLLFYFLTTDMV